MIKKIESFVFERLKDILEEKNVKIYRGFLPEQKHSDREKGKDVDTYFPFVLLRLTEFGEARLGIDNYDVPVNFEIWIGTKEEKEEDYLNNIELGDFIREKLLEESTKAGSLSIDIEKGFRGTFYSDQSKPFFYSRCIFTVTGCPSTSKVVGKEILGLLGRSE